MRRSHLVVPCVALALLAGCVSKSKYDALEAERVSIAKEIETARSDKQALQERATRLETEKATVERQVTALTERVAETEKRATTVGSQKDEEINRLHSTYDTLVKDLQGEIAKGEIKVTQIRDRLSVQLVEKILFESGKAQISEQGLEVLTKVGQILRTVKDRRIQIEGYTDTVPISGPLRQRFPTNWELSTQRATTVVRFLQEKSGIDGKYLSVVGYGPFRPVASNTTPEGRAENRRIEIVLTPLDVKDVLKDVP